MERPKPSDRKRDKRLKQSFYRGLRVAVRRLLPFLQAFAALFTIVKLLGS